jgi:uncharacterized alpha-E superfamily protein
VRDRLSADTWRLLSRLVGQPGKAPLAPMEALSVLDMLVLDLAAFSGMEMENMTRGHGWLFLDFGRRLERAGNLLALIQAVAGAGEHGELLYEPMLEICDSVITFRRRYFAAIRFPDALELLLLQADNPRSLAFQLDVLERGGDALPKKVNPACVAQIRGEIAVLAAKLRAMEIDPRGPLLDGKPLAEMLGYFAMRLRSLSDALTQTYFSHSIPRVN